MMALLVLYGMSLVKVDWVIDLLILDVFAFIQSQALTMAAKKHEGSG